MMASARAPSPCLIASSTTISMSRAWGELACSTTKAEGDAKGFPRTRSFPVVERYGFIWVWTGDAKLADPNEIHPLELPAGCTTSSATTA